MKKSEIIDELRSEAKSMLERAKYLEDSESEMSSHHYNGSDRCWEVYCTGCDAHLRELRSEAAIPLASEAYCWKCR